MLKERRCEYDRINLFIGELICGEGFGSPHRAMGLSEGEL